MQKTLTSFGLMKCRSKGKKVTSGEQKECCTRMRKGLPIRTINKKDIIYVSYVVKREREKKLDRPAITTVSLRQELAEFSKPIGDKST